MLAVSNIDAYEPAEPVGMRGTSSGFDAAAVAVIAAAAPAAPPPPSADSLLLQQYGIDLATLDAPLANAVRSRVSVGTDGKLNVSGLYYNGLGDDLTGKIAQSRNDLTTWIPLGGQENYAGGDSGTTYIVPIANVAQYSGGGGVLRADSPPEAALASLNAIATLAQHAPAAPSYLTAPEAAVFDRLIAGTGDYNFARMDQKTLTGVLHALRANADGSLNMSGVYGGGLGYDPGPPSDQMAVSRELHVMTDEYGQPTGQYLYYSPTGSWGEGGESYATVMFTPPDPSVGSIVMEERGGGGDNGYWQVPVYKPSEATIAKYNADLKTYNDTFGQLTTNGLIQVRPNGQSLNIGNENGYYSAANMGFHPAFGLFTSTQNIKPEDEGGFWGFLDTFVPMVIGAVFSYFGGPIGAFAFSYVMSDGDLDKALTGAALSYVTGGMGGGAEGGISGLAGYMGVENAIAAAAINGGAAGAIGAAANGGDLDAILAGGLTGAATGALGSYITAGVSTDIPKPVATAIGNGVAGVANAALTGGDIDQAALNGMVGVLGAGAGQAIVGAGFSDSSPVVQAAVAAGTSALVGGLVNSAVNDIPLGVALGQGLGAAVIGAIKADDQLSRQAGIPGTPGFVGPPAPVETPAFMGTPAPVADAYDWYDSGMPAETVVTAPAVAAPAADTVVPASDPAPAAPVADAAPAEPVADTAPAPAAPAAPPATGWEWYDDGMPVLEATLQTVPVQTVPSMVTGGENDNRDPQPAATVPTATDTPATTGAADSFVGPPAPASNDNAQAAPASPTRTVVVGSAPKTSTVSDIARNAGGANLSTQIGQIIWANRMTSSTVHDGDPISVTPATADNYTEAQLKAFTRLGNAVLAQDNARLAAIRQAELAAEQARIAQQAAEQRQRSTVTTVSTTPDGTGMMSLDEMAAIRARYSNGATVEPTLLDRALRGANDGAGAVMQWIRDNPRTMGVVQAVGGVAETVASTGLAVGGTVTTATGVGAPVGVPLQVLGWAGIVNGIDNISTGVQTAWNGTYRPTVTQQLAGATASALGASPEMVQKVETVVGFGQAVLGAGATGQAMTLKPLPYTPSRPAAPPAPEPSAVQQAEAATQQALKDVSAIPPQPVYFSTGTRIIPLEVDAAGNTTLANRVTQYFDLQGRPTVSVTEFVDRVPTTNATGRSKLAQNDQSTIGRASGREIGESSTGGHLAPRVVVGDDIGKSGIVGEPLRVQQQGSLIDDAITGLFAPSAAAGQATGSPLSGRLVTTADYSISNRAFSPDIVTRELTVLQRTPDLVSAATELPVARLTVVTDQLPMPGPIALAERPSVFTDLTALPAETGLTTVATSQLPLSARVARFDVLQEANLALNKTPEFIQGAYSPKGQISALKYMDNGSMMPTAAEISAMAERMNVPVTPELVDLANTQRIQQVAAIRYRTAEAEQAALLQQANPTTAAIEAAQLKLDRAAALLDWIFVGPPKP